MSVEARNLRNRQVFGPEQQVFDDYMRTVLDITEEEIRGAVRTQGLATFSDFIGMESQDIKSIVEAIRKPGGSVARPTENDPNAIVANPGVGIGHMAARRLEMVRYYVNHCARIQRLPVVPGDMTLQRLNAVYLHFKNEKEQPEVELPGKIIKIDDVRTNIEDLDSYLQSVLLRGITSSNLQSAVQAVNANRHLKSNYDAAVNFLAEANDTLKAMASAKRNVSAVSGTNKKGGSKGGDKSNKKKKTGTGYMKHTDWWKLTEAQRNEIRNKRKNSSGNSTSSGNQRVQAVVTGTTTDVSAISESTGTTNTNNDSNNNTQGVGAVMTRRNRGSN